MHDNKEGSLNNPAIDPLPLDPSNTNSIGQKVEQGIIEIKDGISEQSSEWEDVQERNIPDNTRVAGRAENYIKDPSPEEMNIEEDQVEGETV